MKARTIVLWLVVLLIPGPSASFGQTPPAQPARGATAAVAVRQQFQGAAEMRINNRAQPVRVDIRLWSLANSQRLAALELPFRGLVIVVLRAGSVTTTIGGRRVGRREGEIWSVPSGSAMQLETGDNMATLQTTVIAD